MENFKKIIISMVLCIFTSLRANNTESLVNTLIQYRLQLEKGITVENKNIPYTMVHQYYFPLLKSKQYPELKNCFEEFFNTKVVTNISESSVLSDLDKQIFYFFLAEYLRIYQDNSKYEQFLNLVKEKTKENWQNKPGKVWKSEKLNTKGKKERIENILNNKYNGDKSYYNAITDSELFLMATGSSLSIIDSQDRDCAEMRNSFYKVLKNLVVFQDNNQWILQPNVWRDHKDYTSISKNVEVDWDASHFSRMPAYLNLLRLSDLPDNGKLYIKRLQSGLISKFLQKVVQYNSKNKQYSFNNYMNGINASYRVNYKTKPGGFASGENSTHIFYCWWRLLEDERIDNMYKSILSDFGYYSSQNGQVNARKEFYKELLSL